MTVLQKIKRALFARPSTELRREIETIKDRVRRDLHHDPPCLRPDIVAARHAVAEKQEEISTRVNNLVNHMQAVSGKTDLLWEEHERRRRESPYYTGPEKRVFDVGPPLKLERNH